ncbi:MAG: hypothetical protein NTNFB02_35060 [Nitrospira sp.]
MANELNSLFSVAAITEHHSQLASYTEDFPKAIGNAVIVLTVFEFENRMREAPMTLSHEVKSHNIQA